MATITKDLGMVTAFAYAVSKGYTGTEDDFAVLMASYADVAEQAAESAAQAGASATAAEQAKAEAVLSASTAASSASTASTKASEAASSASSANGSANTATTKANEASTSATNAASSASAAATNAINAGASATAAAGSASSAETAKTAAETAQGKAEDAQAAAETAAASVSASAAQITQNTEDISDLKSAFTANEVNLGDVLKTQSTIAIKLDYEQGSRNGDTPVATNTRIRAKEFCLFAPYKTLTFNIASGYKFELDYYDINGNYLGRYGRGWLTDNVTLDVTLFTNPKRFSVLIANTSNTAISVDEGASALTITGTSALYNAFSEVFKITRKQTISDTSVFADANKAPVNTAFNILNNGTPIANLPAQIGTLISLNAISNNTDVNFEVQLFVDAANTAYHRIKVNNSWTTWSGSSPRSELFDLPLSSARKILLVGDSLTQGQGSTGYVTYTKEEDGTIYTIRGNGPDYPSAGADYQVGTFLWQSNTTRWYEALDGNGWAQKIKAYFESKFNCSVLNYGMSGVNSTDLLQYVDTLIVPSDADTVIIMLGANDRSNNSLSTYYANYKSACTKIINSGKKLIILSESPVSVANDGTSDRRFHMEDVAHVSMKIAGELGAQFVNLYESFMDYCDETGTTIDSLLSDGLHPNDSGYELMFKIVTRGVAISRKRPGATW